MTRVIILAAGSGSRLKSESGGVPKSLVDLGGVNLFDLNLRSLDLAGVEKSDVTVILGYESPLFATTVTDCKVLINANWESSSQVESLAIALLEDSPGPKLALYGDVFHNVEAIRIYLASLDEPYVGSFLDWRACWEARYENPLDDLEEFRFVRSGSQRILLKIGGKPATMSEIQGQFSGAFAVHPELRDFVLEHRRCWCSTSITDLLSHFLFLGGKLSVVSIGGPWFEIDTPNDLRYARSVVRTIDAQETG